MSEFLGAILVGLILAGVAGFFWCMIKGAYSIGILLSALFMTEEEYHDYLQQELDRLESED